MSTGQNCSWLWPHSHLTLVTLTASALAAGSSAAPAATHSAARAATVQDGDLAAGADHRRRPWPRALSIRERQARSRRLHRSLRDLLAAAARTGQAGGRPRSQASAARRHASCQRDQAGDLRRTPARPLRPGHQAGTDERPGLAHLRRRLVRAPHPKARRSIKMTMEPAAHVFGPILAISGSLRRDSINSAVLRAAAAAARDGIAARIDDSPRALPHFDPDLEPFPPGAVLRFRRVCADATGCWLAVQEYALSGRMWVDGVRTTHSASKDRGVATVRTNPRGPHDVVSLAR